MKAITHLAGALALAFATTAPAQPAPAQPVLGLYAVKIAVKDFQKAIDFYGKLGMKPGTKYNAMEWELTWGAPGRGSSIVLVRDESGRMHVTPSGGFLVVAVADVRATANALKAAGYAGIGTPAVTPMAAMLMLKDPDGNQIELVGPGSK